MLPDVPAAALISAIREFDRDLRDKEEWANWQSNRAHRLNSP